jgi:hypothetical protein
MPYNNLQAYRAIKIGCNAMAALFARCFGTKMIWVNVTHIVLCYKSTIRSIYMKMGAFIDKWVDAIVAKPCLAHLQGALSPISHRQQA